jgi:DNA-binding transcriptional MocR family regulator
VPRFKQTIPIDDYVLDVLMRDLIGHDQQPAAYLVYLYLYGQAARKKWKPVVASLRTLADATGLSKSAIQIALATLRRRELIVTTRNHATATSRHRVLRHWRAQRCSGPAKADVSRNLNKRCSQRPVAGSHRHQFHARQTAHSAVATAARTLAQVL